MKAYPFARGVERGQELAARGAGNEQRELGRRHDGEAIAADAVAQQPLRLAEAIDFGGVEEVDAAVEERLVGLEHRLIVRTLAPFVVPTPRGEILAPVAPRRRSLFSSSAAMFRPLVRDAMFPNSRR